MEGARYDERERIFVLLLLYRSVERARAFRVHFLLLVQRFRLRKDIGFHAFLQLWTHYYH